MDPTVVGLIVGGVVSVSVAAIQYLRKPSSPAEVMDAMSEAATALVQQTRQDNDRLRAELAQVVAQHAEDMALIIARFHTLETVVRRLLATHNGKIDPAMRGELESAIEPA